MLAEQNADGRRRNRSEAAQWREKDARLRREYGIGLDDFDRLLEKQEGRCAICRTDVPGGPTPTSRFHVDHDHHSGKVRGLLCRACNMALGLLKEDRERIEALLAYLWPACERHEPKIVEES
jgi:hypothetical protein